MNRYHEQGGKEKAKEYFENNKERLKEQAQNKYRELSIEEKGLKKEYEEIDIETCFKKIYQKTYREAKKYNHNFVFCII